MKRFQARTEIEARPSAVIEILTDPAAARHWAPVDFEVDRDDVRFETGSTMSVSGRVAGRRVSFDLSVLDAGRRHLSLSASGPVQLTADYEAMETDRGTELVASLSVTSSGGIRGKLVSSAAEAMLAGGALDHALERIARTAVAV